METQAKKKRGPQPGSTRRSKEAKTIILETKIIKKETEPHLGGERGKSVRSMPYTPTAAGIVSITSTPKKEMVNHPSHYNQYPIEGIDMLIGIFGLEKTIDFCIMTAMKYRLRIGLKDDINQDLAKEKWYLDKAKELDERLVAINGLNKTR